MVGLTLGCAALALVCLIRNLLLNRRIRKLTAKIEASQPVDVALEEDALAQLQNAAADLQQALERTKRLNAEECARTSQLTADISHQLKTPLTTLRLFTEMDEGSHMEGCLEQIQRMEHLIGSLLRLERLCADGYAFTFERVNAEELLLEQWQSLQPLWPQKQLRVHGHAQIRCDCHWMGEAFLNLLKNACEHTRSDGKILVRLERTEAAFFCTIEDNGGGVSGAELPKLFQRFYRAEHQSTGGAGIGLAIVKEIIHRHHGTITAENGAMGLKLTITMPMLDRYLTNS